MYHLSVDVIPSSFRSKYTNIECFDHRLPVVAQLSSLPIVFRPSRMPIAFSYSRMEWSVLPFVFFLIFDLLGSGEGKTRRIAQITRPLPCIGQCSSIHGYRWSENWSLIFQLKHCFREARYFSDRRGRTNVRSSILKCPHFTQITQRRYGHYSARERERSRKIEEGSVKWMTKVRDE